MNKIYKHDVDAPVVTGGLRKLSSVDKVLGSNLVHHKKKFISGDSKDWCSRKLK